jgi:hypothetical protein
MLSENIMLSANNTCYQLIKQNIVIEADNTWKQKM